jgi:hypothetical protein
MTRYYSRDSGNKFNVLPLTLKPRPKKNLWEYGVSKYTNVCSVSLPLPLSQQNRSCQTLKIYRRKWSIKNSNLVTLELHVRRDPHYFILNSILHPYIRKSANESDVLIKEENLILFLMPLTQFWINFR